jgi:spore coat polysaccharide biosynthesis predicted glycosyltransferase SpsG
MKKKIIYFRVFYNNNSGLGHLKRSLRLYSFLKNKYNIKLFVDKKTTSINLITKNKLNYLYDAKINFYNSTLDAKLFLKNTKQPGFVILDDYRANLHWQNLVKKKHKGLIIFDDFLDKKYNADIIINSKPDFLNNYHVKRYNILNNNSLNLLGPKYCLIDKKFILVPKKKNNFLITFYLGGTGDLKFIYRIIKNLKKNNEILFNKISINVVKNYHSKNQNLIKEFSKNFDNVKIVKPCKFLFKKINNTNLLISGAGISIFESALYKIPSIFFCLSKNQIVDISSFQKLGHLFYLNFKDLRQSSKISQLIYLIYLNYSIVNRHYKKFKTVVDEKGSRRISNKINFFIENEENN